MEGCSLVEAARKLQAMTCSSDPRKSTPNGKELVTKRRRVPFLNFTLTGIDCSHPYLALRGITEKTAVDSPIPRAKVAIAVSAKPVERIRLRIARRTSVVSICLPSSRPAL